MSVVITITPEMYIAIASLIKSGVELIGDFTEEKLIQMARDQEARSDRLQQRQEGG